MALPRQGLKQAFNGDGTTLLVLSDAYFNREPDGTYGDNIGEVIYAVNCLDVSEPPTQAEVEAALPRFEKVSPVFGRALGWGALGCATGRSRRRTRRSRSPARVHRRSS